MSKNNKPKGVSMADSISKIRDVVTGQVLSVRPEIFKKRAEKCGGEDALLRSYVGRDTKRLLREGKSVDQIRKELGVDASELPSSTDLADVIADITTVKRGKGKKAADEE
jgi:hypothetical protein